VALSGTTGVRGRLRAIVDTSRVVRAPSRRALATASLVSAMAALPIGAIRVAPTRDVLTTLMRDGHWESRAYAVVHLAQRPDSVEVARMPPYTIPVRVCGRGAGSPLAGARP
jgi:hypothetical protein